MEYEKTAVSLLIVLWIFNSSIPSMVFTPSSHYFPSVSGASANLPRSRGTVPPPQWGTNGRCSTIVEESKGLTSLLDSLLLFFERIIIATAQLAVRVSEVKQLNVNLN